MHAAQQLARPSFSPAVFDPALYERATKKSGRFDRDFYDKCAEERRANGISGAAQGAIAGSKHASAGGTPATIVTSGPTLALWWNADDSVVTTGHVTSIVDRSGNSKTGTPVASGGTLNATDANISGKASVSFTTVQTLYCAAGLVLTPPYMILHVARLTTWTSTSTLIGDTASGTKGSIACAGGTPNIYLANPSYANTLACTIGGWALYWGKFTHSTNDQLKVGASTVGGSGTGTDSGNSSTANLCINGAGAGLAEDWRETFVYTGGIPTSGECTALIAYVVAQSGSIAA